MKTLFITATGTGIGKTVVTALIARQIAAAGTSVRVLKPVISGYDAQTHDESDTAMILRALGKAETDEAIADVSPWRYKAPLAPDMAAARENTTLDFAAMTAFCRDAAAGPEDILLIEGVGGLMVPLTDRETVLDWIKALRAPSVIVAGSYLGTISHTLTALETADKYDIDIAAIILSESEESPVPLAETAADISCFKPGIPILELPRLQNPFGPTEAAPDLAGQLGLV